jgi:hypothetical protein
VTPSCPILFIVANHRSSKISIISPTITIYQPTLDNNTKSPPPNRAFTYQNALSHSLFRSSTHPLIHPSKRHNIPEREMCRSVKWFWKCGCWKETVLERCEREFEKNHKMKKDTRTSVIKCDDCYYRGADAGG